MTRFFRNDALPVQQIPGANAGRPLMPHPAAPVAVLDPTPITPEFLQLATCPLCQKTDATMTHDALGNGADWRCTRCGQSWSALRLTTVAAYAEWVSAQPIASKVIS